MQSSGLYPNLSQVSSHLPSEGLTSGEKSAIYHTKGGRSFRCIEQKDADIVNLLFCSMDQGHIMEGRSMYATVVESTRSILNLIPNLDGDLSLLQDLGDRQLAACNTCVPDGPLYSGYVEHKELTELSQSLLVQCAHKEEATDECGAAVFLSELPQHHEDKHLHRSPAGKLTEPHRAADIPVYGQSSQVEPLPSVPFSSEQAGATAIEPGGQDRLAVETAIKKEIEDMVSGVEVFKTLVGQSIKRQDEQISAQMEQQTKVQSCLEDLTGAMPEYVRRLAELEQGMEALKKQVGEFAQIQLDQNSAHTEQQKNVQSRLDYLTGAMPDYVQRLEALEQTMKEFSVKSNRKIHALEEQLRLIANGTFVWKLENFNKTVNEFAAASAAGATAPNCVLSDHFYTAPNGYKLRAAIYPCGDGPAFGSHVSLFIAVMKGEYDDHVAWPMDKKVTFEVLDNEANQTYSCNFATDRRRASFQKPISDVNESCGVQDFLPMEKVNDLLHEDGCLYIRIKVEDKEDRSR